MKKILLVSDTHGYQGDDLLKHCAWADEVWHGGDWLTTGLYEAITRLGKPVRSVYGNVDGQNLRQLFPPELFFNLDGLKVYMTHIGGYPGRYGKGVKSRLLHFQPDLFISGHSHILKVSRDPEINNLLHMNPGAAGIHGFHHRRTLLRFQVKEGKVDQLEMVDLGPRVGEFKRENFPG